MSIVVFLGPTMPLSQAQELLPDAVFRGPAAQSDIITVVDTLAPAAIAIIDGVFTQALSVWHKEILYALERGIAVYGASSMGALRVAETATFGAVGVGAIYQAYASGELNDDDEVAVMHATAEDGFMSLSDAMVNIRATVAAAVSAQVITEEQHDLLIDLAKSRFFTERTWAQLFRDAGEHLSDAAIHELKDFVRNYGIDQKREDAIELLTMLAEQGVTPPPPVQVTRSHPFLAMYQRDRRVARGSTEVPLADIGAYAALHTSEFEALNEHALNSALVDILAEMLKIEVSEADVQAERQRFFARLRILSEQAQATWLTDNDLTVVDAEEFFTKLASRRALRNWYISRKYLERTTEEVLTELRVRNQYQQVADATAQQQRLLDNVAPDLAFRGEEEDLLSLIKGQARASAWRPTVPLDIWAFENGFKDVFDVRYELVRAKLAREALQASLASLGANTVAPDPASK